MLTLGGKSSIIVSKKCTKKILTINELRSLHYFYFSITSVNKIHVLSSPMKKVMLAEITSSLDRRGHKIRGTQLPQEYDLDRLLLNVSHRHLTWSTATPACAWKGIECLETEKVRSINWDLLEVETYIRGQLDFIFLPLSVVKFHK